MAAVAPLLWRLSAGADGLPAGDAWAYERIYDTFHRTGDVRLVNWNDITLVGMLPITWLWTAVVGYGSTRLHVLGSVACAVALTGMRSVMVSLGVRQRVPALVVLALFSGFVGVTGTYLSDSFAVAGAIWAVALALRASRRPSPVAALGAGIAAAFGFMVRQQAIVGALGAGRVLWGRRRSRTALVMFLAAFALITVPAYLYRASLEHGGSVHFGIHPRGIVAGLEGMVMSLGALWFAAFMWLRNRRRSGLHACIAAALGIVGTFVLYVTRSVTTPADWWVSDWANGPTTVGVLVAIATLAAAARGWMWMTEFVLTSLRTEAREHVRAVTAACAVGLATELAVLFLSGAYFARYSLFVALLSVALIHTARVEVTAAALTVSAMFGVASYWKLDDSVASTGAILDAATVVECVGVPPERFDATFSWNGKYFRGVASTDHEREVPSDGLPPTDDHRTFSGMRRDAVLTPYEPDRRPDWVVVGSFRSSGLLPRTAHTWWLTVRPSAQPAVARCAHLINDQYDE